MHVVDQRLNFKEFEFYFNDDGSFVMESYAM